MEKDELYEIMIAAYAKKSFEMNKRTEMFFDFDDFVFSIIQQRYGTKKKVKRKAIEFFVGLEHYATHDERIDTLKRFVGFECQPYSRHLLEFYFEIMKQTNESTK